MSLILSSNNLILSDWNPVYHPLLFLLLAMPTACKQIEIKINEMNSIQVNSIQFNSTNIPADIDVVKTSLGCLKKVTTSYDQIRPPHNVWQKASDLHCREDVRFTTSISYRTTYV